MTAHHAPRQDDWSYRSTSAEDTERLGRIVGACLEGGEVIALYGDLGTGKTTLVRGLAAGIGAPPRAVSSPTFVLVHEYHGRLRLAHADLYRISSALELHHTGLMDYFDRSTVTVIEWAEKAAGELPSDRLEVRLSHDGVSTRRLTMSGLGRHATELLIRIRTTMAEAP